MGKFLEKYNLPKATQAPRENGSGPRVIRELEFALLRLLAEGSPGPHTFINKPCQKSKEVTPQYTNSGNRGGDTS